MLPVLVFLCAGVVGKWRAGRSHRFPLSFFHPPVFYRSLKRGQEAAKKKKKERKEQQCRVQAFEGKNCAGDIFPIWLGAEGLPSSSLANWISKYLISCNSIFCLLHVILNSSSKIEAE